MQSHAAKILSLYRSMLRKGRQLHLTDKDYFFSRVQKEFKANKDLQNEEEIDKCISKAEALLKSDRLI